MGLRSPLHVHVPYPSLDALLPTLLRDRLPPEVALGRASLPSMLAGEAAGALAALAEAALPVSIHGPFGDLVPGAPRREEREACLATMRTALEAAALARPLTVVLHPGLPAGAGAPALREHVARGIETWLRLLPLPPGLAGAWIAIENIFEEEPEPIARLLAALPSPPFGFCFDAGHAQMFSRAQLERWFEALGGRLREVHLHDNEGGSDDHLPPGRGSVECPRLLGLLERLPQPVVGTLEMHSLPELREGIDALRALGVR